MMNLGDKRLNKRGTNLLKAMSKKQTVVLRQLGDRNEEIGYGRFLKNEKVKPMQIAAPSISKTTKNTKGKHVLWINDTSTMSYGKTPIAGPMPPVDNNNMSHGFYLHPVLGLNAADGTCLGLGSVKLFERVIYQEDDPRFTAEGRKKWRHNTPLKEKESYRWLEIPLKAVNNNSDAVRHTVIGDQESDIYEVMVKLSRKKIDFLFRTGYNRRIVEISFSHLKSHLNDKTTGYTFELKVAKTDKRSAHTAILDVKWSSVEIKRSDHGGGYTKLPKHLKVNVVQINERAQSVVGKEKPIHWMLLTSHEVKNQQDAQQIILWYTWRWMIEQFFRSMKAKGLDIENAQVESVASLHNLSVATLCSAIIIMQLIQARDGENNMDMDVVFDSPEIKLIHELSPELEGNTQKLKNPYEKNSLAFATWVIARLGGWKGYRSQRPPGPKDIKKGLQDFYTMLWYRKKIHKANEYT